MTTLNGAHPAPGFTPWPVTPRGAMPVVWQSQSHGILGCVAGCVNEDL